MYSKTKKFTGKRKAVSGKATKALALLGVTALVTTGCADVTQTSNIAKNGQLTLETTILTEKTATDQYFQESVGTSFITLNSVLPGVETVQKDGKSYYYFEDKQDTTIAGLYNYKFEGDEIIQDMIAVDGLVYNYTETCVDINSTRLLNQIAADQESAAAFDELLKQVTSSTTITFPYKVTKTNGTLSEDGYTVTFNDAQSKTSRQYAFTEADYSLSGITEGGISPKNKVSFAQGISVKEGSKAIANGATLSDGSHVLTATKDGVQKTIFTVVDTTGPVFHYLKNKKYYRYVYGSVSDKTTSVASVKIDKKLSKHGTYIDVTKNGKHTVVAKDIAGNTSKCTFYVDNKRPSIKGVKNKKTYNKAVKIKCKDNMKLKSVKVNGKKKKASFKLTKKGKYTIIAQDQAGNMSIVKITIK